MDLVLVCTDGTNLFVNENLFQNVTAHVYELNLSLSMFDIGTAYVN